MNIFEATAGIGRYDTQRYINEITKFDDSRAMQEAERTGFKNFQNLPLRQQHDIWNKFKRQEEELNFRLNREDI